MNSQDLLQLVEKETIIEILEEFGSPCLGMGTTSEGVNYLKFRTVCHNGSSDKLWWYENTKNFQCWTCCGSMSLYTLVMKVRNCSFKESLNYVASKVGISVSDSERYGIQDDASAKFYQNRTNKLTQDWNETHNKAELRSITKFYDPKVLRYFDSNAFYQGWINEGITEEVMRKFNISFDWLEGHIIIPHYNIDGKLVGIRRRSLNPEDANNKYMPEFLHGVMYEHPLGLNLYGLYENHEAIKKRRMAIIVEGEKSVMQSNSFYGDDSIALATCGFNISDWQMRMLHKLDVNTVYLGFDKDFDITQEAIYMRDKVTWENYTRYIKRIEVLCERLQRSFKTFKIVDTHHLLDIKDSPTDKGKEVFDRLKKEAVEIT